MTAFVAASGKDVRHRGGDACAAIDFHVPDTIPTPKWDDTHCR